MSAQETIDLPVMRRAVEYAARAGVRRVLGRREYVEPSETRCYPASGWHPIKTVTGDPVQGELDGTGQVSGVEWKRRCSWEMRGGGLPRGERRGSFLSRRKAD